MSVFFVRGGAVALGSSSFVLGVLSMFTQVVLSLLLNQKCLIDFDLRLWLDKR
jgi:hypothetical protein